LDIFHLILKNDGYNGQDCRKILLSKPEIGKLLAVLYRSNVAKSLTVPT
jgi:hypothetical protein